jgi:D-alanyl-D-alanine carboxypeptidase (penicillin-binding protein 5/6)
MARHARIVYVRRRIAVGVVAVLGIAGIGLGGYSAVALGLPLPETQPTISAPALPAGVEAAPAPAPFGSSGIGVIGWADPLVAAGDPSPRPIASITKVITALVVLSAMPITEGDGPTRTLTAQDAAYYDDAVANAESRVPAPEGSVITERDAIEAMIVSSSANHARMLADWAFGSQEAFLVAAQAWLTAQGLIETTIVEPTGADPGNTSTVPELIRIAGLAVADPVLAGIVAQPTADIPDVGPIASTNALLGIDGIDGIKTGTLDEAGACLLFSADVVVGSRTVTLVGVVLGGPDHDAVDASVRTLLASAVAGLSELDVPAGTAFGAYETPWGGAASAVSSAPASFLVWGPDPVTAAVDLDPLTTAPDDTEVGDVSLSTTRDSFIVPLMLDAAIDDPGSGWRWTHPDRAAS